MKNSIKICLAALGLVLMGCEPIYIGGKLEESGGGGMEHPFSTDVALYDGRLASDSLADIVGRDPYVFWEHYSTNRTRNHKGIVKPEIHVIYLWK